MQPTSAPFEETNPLAPGRRAWESAPDIVRKWAYGFNLFVIVVIGLGLLLLITGAIGFNGEFRKFAIGIYTAIWLFFGWHNFNLKKGAPIAWRVQILVSAWGVWGFPILTYIHWKILSRWSEPETKAWFGLK